MSDNNNRRRRRTYIVRMDFQKDFILRFCVLIIGAAMIVSGIVYAICGTTVVTTFKASRLKILSTADFIGPYLLLSSLIAIIIAGVACWWMMLIISNRIAGPVYRFEKEIARMTTEGDLTMNFRLRQKDEFQSLAQILNDMTKDLRTDVKALKEHVAALERAGQLTPEGLQALNRAKQILAKYKV